MLIILLTIIVSINVRHWFLVPIFVLAAHLVVAAMHSYIGALSIPNLVVSAIITLIVGVASRSLYQWFTRKREQDDRARKRKKLTILLAGIAAIIIAVNIWLFYQGIQAGIADAERTHLGQPQTNQ